MHQNKCISKFHPMFYSFVNFSPYASDHALCFQWHRVSPPFSTLWITGQWTKSTCMVWMNKLLKEGPSLCHSSMGLNVFLFNFWFHKSGHFFWLKRDILCWRNSHHNSQNCKSLPPKNINPWWDLNFKINLDFHGKCKIKTSVILEGHLYATHEFHLSTS
jgi:hypothetical protein